MDNSQVEVLVNGKPIKQHSFDWKFWIEAREGTEYSIKIKNNSFRRKLAIVTVDGLNAISGKPQDDSIGQGYIVNAYNVLEVKGFRKDEETVGAFKFCKKGNSYCNEQGLKGNNGVIGIRLYDEKQAWVTFSSSNEIKNAPFYSPSSIPTCTSYPILTCSAENVYRSNSSTGDSGENYKSLDSCDISKTLRSESPKFDLGTTWGQKIEDKVTTVEFEVDESTKQELVLYYDTRANLEAMGLVLKEQKQVCFPKAFGAYATPPKNWKG